MTPTLDEIRRTGLRALLQALGPVGMVRFLQQFSNGKGDYTKDRWKWLPDGNVVELLDKFERQSGTEDQTVSDLGEAVTANGAK